MNRFPVLGINTTTYCLAAGHDGSEKSIIEATDAHLDLLRTDKPAAYPWLGLTEPKCGRPIRFLQSGLGFEKDAWHDPAIDVIVVRRCVERGFPVLWTIFNDNPDVPGATPDASGIARQRLVAREIIAARSIHDESGWFFKTLSRERNRFDGLPVRFEFVNADLILGRMLTTAQTAYIRSPMGGAIYGGFAYDYREGDCKLRKSRWNPRLISEFGVDWTTVIDDTYIVSFVDIRFAHLIGLMKSAGVKQAYLHEACSRGYRYDPAVWKNMADTEGATMTSDAVKFGWFSTGGSTPALWQLDRLWDWGAA